MSDHDPLCPFNRTQQQGCKCPWIIRARIDERQRFADIPDTFRLLAVSTDHEVTRAAYLFAADLVATRIDEASQ